MSILDNDIKKLEYLNGAKFLHAYIECSDTIQKDIVDLLRILHDDSVDPDDRDMALFTLADCLFPNAHDGELGMDLEQSEEMGAAYSAEMRDALEELNLEEASFAEQLKNEMDRQGLTQEDLARKVGVQQSAISNMLSRQCRPQKRTIKRFAEALGVSASTLWPNTTS
jgi:lambda repressor-like predicted transcriptional regulator